MAPLQNNKSFLDLICLKLVFLTRFQKLQESYKYVCSLVRQTKSSRKTYALSFLSSVLQVRNLWRYSNVRPIAVLHYVSFHRCMFVRKHIPSHYMTHDRCVFLLFSLKICLTFFVINFIVILY